MNKVWIEQGVYLDLQPEMLNGLQKIRTLFMLEKQDLYITSGSEGDHQMNSFHYSGKAIDIRKAKGITKAKLQHVLGEHFDIISYSWGWHCEHDYRPF